MLFRIAVLLPLEPRAEYLDLLRMQGSKQWLDEEPAGQQHAPHSVCPGSRAG
jgi:hypothetical protein